VLPVTGSISLDPCIEAYMWRKCGCLFLRTRSFFLKPRGTVPMTLHRSNHGRGGKLVKALVRRMVAFCAARDSKEIRAGMDRCLRVPLPPAQSDSSRKCAQENSCVWPMRKNEKVQNGGSKLKTSKVLLAKTGIVYLLLHACCIQRQTMHGAVRNKRREPRITSLGPCESSRRVFRVTGHKHWQIPSCPAATGAFFLRLSDCLAHRTTDCYNARFHRIRS